MKSRFLPFAAILVAAFVSCQQTQSFEVNKLEALGTVELTFDLQNNSAKAAFVSSRLNTQALLANQTSVSFASSQFQVFTSGVNKFLVAKFNVSNSSGGTLTDLALVAYRKTGNRSDTAILNLQNFQSLTSPTLDAYALAIKPAHAMTNATTVNSAEADTQFFTEAEVTTMQGQASGLLTGGDYLFPYGYIARATGSTTSRSITNGANTGTLTVGVKLPGTNEPGSAITRFSMTFIAFTQPTASRVSESLEEQGSTTANTRKTSLSATELFALGGSSLLSNPSVKRGCVIRTAGASGAATATLVDTFSLSTTPIANSFNAAVSANLDLTLDRNGVTPAAANWITRGEFTGDKAGAFSGGSSTLTFNPTSNFKPGELVTSTLKSGAITTSPAANPCVTGAKTWQFRAGVTAGGGAYGANNEFATGPGPFATLGDMNNDGNLDVVAVSDNSSKVSVLLGNGAGGFGAKSDFTVGTTPFTLAVGDVNADGKLDIVSANYGSNNASVLINNFTNAATPSFATKQDFATGTHPYSVALADVSNDGILDMIVSNYGLADTTADDVTVRLGTGTGTIFAPTTGTYGTGNKPTIVTVGDVNNDGKLDLVVANQVPIGGGSNYTVSVLLGNGDGSFQSAVDYPTTFGPLSVALGDFNGDGSLDIVVANGSTVNPSVSVLLNTGTGTFISKVDYTTGVYLYSVAVGDVNGDGKLDIVTANYNSASASVLTNTGTGNSSNGTGWFNPKVDPTTGANPISVSLGDVNNDGKLDIVTANYNDGNLAGVNDSISVLLHP
jgi:hypothetical protein